MIGVPCAYLLARCLPAIEAVLIVIAIIESIFTRSEAFPPEEKQ